MVFNTVVNCSKILVRTSYVAKVHGSWAGKRLGFPWDGFKNSIHLGCTHNYSSRTTFILNTPGAIQYLNKVRAECEQTQFDSSTTINKQNSKFLLDLFKKRDELLENISNVEEMSTEKDEELQSLAQEEKESFTRSLEEVEDAILTELMPPDKHSSYRDVQMEITGGAGGLESMIFAAELLEMYTKFAQYMGWKFELVEHLLTRDGPGGLRKCTAFVSGDMAYRCLRYESGVHRVQRIPVTDKNKRMHTSTAAVVILPQPSEVDIVINSKDLVIETMRASGPGGQHVNKTESAIRITHVPSGMVVEANNNRSQLVNRESAMKKLRTRLYDLEQGKQDSEITSMRRQQMGTRDISEKVRTYNYHQDRITDHRVGGNIHGIASFMEGGEELHQLITRLDEWNKEKNIESFISSLQKRSQKS